MDIVNFVLINLYFCLSLSIIIENNNDIEKLKNDIEKNKINIPIGTIIK
jgi:hypothetical protein